MLDPLLVTSSAISLVQEDVVFHLQVLGGAGPAIAAVPLTVVWAGGSAVTLLSSLGQGKVGPLGAVQRVGFTLSMAFAQVTCTNCTKVLLILLPPSHHQDRHDPCLSAVAHECLNLKLLACHGLTIDHAGLADLHACECTTQVLAFRSL